MPKERSPGKPTTRRYSAEEKAPAVRMVRELRSGAGHRARDGPAGRDQLGYGVESVRSWVQAGRRRRRARPGLTTVEARADQELEQENRELRRANEILKRASGFFAAELDRPRSDRRVHRREPGRVRSRAHLQGAAGRSEHLLRRQEPQPPSARAVRDAVMMPVLSRCGSRTARSTGPTSSGRPRAGPARTWAVTRSPG